MSETNISTIENEELISVACISCGKSIFKFSKNAIYQDVSTRQINLKCPYCEKTTIYNYYGEISLEA